jgi:sarcosine oxidase subunit alpha
MEIKDMRSKTHSITKGKKIAFRFNGKKLIGFQGDTLASALIANDVKLVARSFKYHRPRGVFSSGSEEPNALVELGKGAFQEPNTKATTVELYNGLSANSQNFRGSINFDLMAITGFFSRFLGAGFYYKTFMWPKSFWEKIYEPTIRAAAGLGRLSMKPDPSSYDKGFLHCDFLIVGSGVSGLISALQISQTGAKIILVEEDYLLGGKLNSEDLLIEKTKSSTWAKKSIKKLKSLKNVRILNRTTVYGSFDHGIYGAIERKTDHLSEKKGKPRQILWKIYSNHCILASGALERSMVFPNNDRPGIMLSGAVRTYANRFGVSIGKSAVIFTNNDDGWKTADALSKIGVTISGVIDTRKGVKPLSTKYATYMDNAVVDTYGRKGLSHIKLRSGKILNAEILAVSGGWSSNVHLTCHKRGKPVWDKKTNNFIPSKEVIKENITPVGAVNGIFEINKIADNTQKTISNLLIRLGYRAAKVVQLTTSKETYNNSSTFHIKSRNKECWVDLQNDVTRKDIELSFKEGFRSVEHLKRYSTLGMATDQGKTSNILGLAIIAELEKKHISDIGTTVFRPPYVPIAIGAFAGRSKGRNFKPTRLTPSHKSAENKGAVFVEAGNWLRAQWFPKTGERNWRQSVDREVQQTRSSVGICDVTTLGKIDIQGKDVSEFLNIVYSNAFSRLPINKVRYGLMLREDGIAYDDGTTARLSETHFVMTTTTANAVQVYRHLEFVRQCLTPQLDVHLISTTDSWAQFAIAGPNSRNLLKKIVDKPEEITNERFPFMACRELTICSGVDARLFRISFSGELAYEIAVPTLYGNSLFELLLDKGKEFKITPYGTEALGVMRIEKGHAAGNELNGQTTAQDLGIGKLVSKKGDSIGNILSERSELNRPNGIVMMGFKPIDRKDMLEAGSHIIKKGKEPIMKNDEGWLSSVAFSPMLGHSIGLGFIKGGKKRLGETVLAVNPLKKREIEVEIVSPHFIDPDGEKLRA